MKPKSRALVIDNGEGVCSTLTDLLLRDNYNISMAGCCKEAIKNIEDNYDSQPVSVVLISLDLPDEADGEFMRQADRLGLNCPVIAMSRNTIRLKRIKEYVPKISGHLKKPVSERSFRKTIDQVTQTLQ